MKKRIVVLLLCLLLAVSLSVTAHAAEPEDGSFVLAVCTANNVVIEPVRIPYTAGQTVKEALLASGHEFAGLAERDYIDSIDGVVANYVFAYDNNGYSFDYPASEITAMRFGVTRVPAASCDDMLTMITAMADYSEMENHVQNYPAAQNAYKACLRAMRGDGTEAAARKAELDSAVAAYQEILDGVKYTVSFTALQGGTQLQTPVITMTDAYGNVTTNTGSSIRVIAGDYTFSVSDGGYNRTEGTIKVRQSVSLTVELPHGEWFGEMYMRSYSVAMGYTDPYRSQQDFDTHKTVFWVDDTAHGIYGTNLVVLIGDVPDRQATKLRTIYVSLEEQGSIGMLENRDYSNTNRSWSTSTNTYGNHLYNLIPEGLEGRTFDIEGQFVDGNGHTQIQSFEIEIIRVPTLSSLAVFADGTRLVIGNEGVSQGSGELLPYGYFSNIRNLSATTVSDTLNIVGEPFDDSYSVNGLGDVQITGNFTHEIVVTAENGMSSTYTLSVSKEDSVIVLFDTPDGVDIEIQNSVGSTVNPVNGEYHLIPGDQYTYIATKDSYFHTKASFTVTAGLVIPVAEPITENWLLDLGVYTHSRGTPEFLYEPNSAFSAENHNYTYYVPDSSSVLYFRATKSTGTACAYYYEQAAHHIGEEIRVEILSDVGDQSQLATGMSRFLTLGGYQNELRVRVEKKENEIQYYQDYILTIQRTLHLMDLTASADEDALTLLDDAGNAVQFDRDINEYWILINRDLEEIVINGEYPYAYSGTFHSEQYSGGYSAAVNGTRYNEVPGYKTSTMTGEPMLYWLYMGNIAFPLDTDADTQTVTIEVCHPDPAAIGATYTLHIDKTDPVPVIINADPADLIVCMTNNLNGKRSFERDGVFMLTPGGEYSWTATCAGFVGAQGTYTVPAEGGVLEISLDRAPENESLEQLSVQWPHLRQDNDNNGVVNYPMPIDSSETVLYWAIKVGEGYDASACSPPIMVGGYLYVYAGRTLLKIDPYTGNILASAPMAGASSFAINPPTYADGMIFVGLANGQLQAFNAATLASLWIYKDPLGGQPNCPIVYHNGFVYTGFWQGEEEPANYVCLSATDEDPSQPDEAKLATWTYSSVGGFYWSGAWICDDYLLIGTDDGKASYTTGHPRLLSLNTRTGEPISEVTLSATGDIRCSITYYNGDYYFTCKGGYFFKASVDPSGTITQVTQRQLNNYASSAANPPMSTSTPVIYNGRAYIGVGGTGQFVSYSGHNITVIDVTSMEIIYQVRTKGYPQVSGVLTTAYEQETGKVYVYFLDNMTPGILRVLEDSNDQNAPSLTSLERGYDTALNLFQAVGDQAEYVICSPIVDSYGTMYYKNDSGYLMAVGSAIDHLEITQQPRLTYNAGEIFDSAGLQVVAHFANGTSRDVTDYLTWSEDPLTAEDADFQLLYPIVMYQNVVEDDVVLPGVEYPQPLAVVQLTIEGGNQGTDPEDPQEPDPIRYGDVNGDNAVNMWDYRLVIQYYNDEISLDANQLLAADVNGDGAVNMWDYRLIIQYYNDEISQFPVETQP